VTRALPQRHRWYAACSLGDAEARGRWASEVGVDRLERIRAIQRELGSAIAPYSGRLWELKGQQLLAFRDGRDAGPATEALRHLAGQMTAHLHTFLNEHNTAFTDIDMPVDAARRLIIPPTSPPSGPPTRMPWLMMVLPAGPAATWHSKANRVSGITVVSSRNERPGTTSVS